jgi:hypothetical protein
LGKYAFESGGAFCIDPLNYKEFGNAVLHLFNPVERRELNKNGIEYARTFASFQKEAESYVETIFY